MIKIRMISCAIYMLMAQGGVSWAQNPVPNPGFESWASGEPVDWRSSNPSAPGSITQSADAFSANWAVQGSVVEIIPGLTFAPTLQSNNGALLPVSQRHDSLVGYFKFTSVDSNRFEISVTMFRQGGVMGGAVYTVTTSVPGYTRFAKKIGYTSQETPDNALVAVRVTPAPGPNSPALGTTFWLDDVALTDGAQTPCPVTATGDVNLVGGVNSTDIIYVVNYVLKAGPDPLPCPAAADVNCSGEVNTTDVIYLVNFVLKSGPAPCDVCTLVPGTWSCP